MVSRMRHAGYALGRSSLIAGLLAAGLLIGGAISLGTPTYASNHAVLTASHPCNAKTAKKKVTVKATNGLKFVPATVCLKKGGKVTWHNTGDIPHTTTDKATLASRPKDAVLPQGASSWNHPLKPGKSWSHRFTVAGTYKYFCVPHEDLGMLGRIKVVK